MGHIYMVASGRFPEAGTAGRAGQAEGAGDDCGCGRVFKLLACCEAFGFKPATGSDQTHVGQLL